MDERDESLDPRIDGDDQEFFDLFSSLDSVSASDELMDSTLEAIFSQAESPKAGEDPEPDPKVVAFPKGGGQHSKPKKRKRHHHVLRIAGVAAAVAAFSVGGIAYATPSSYISVNEGGTTLTLGVNSFGVTVSATADTDAGTKLIDDHKVCNKDFADSVRTIATAINSGDGSDEGGASPRVMHASVTSDDVEQRKTIVQGFTQAAEESGFVKEGPAAAGIGAPEAGASQTDESAATTSASEGPEQSSLESAETSSASAESANENAPAPVDTSDGKTDIIGSFVNIPDAAGATKAQTSSKTAKKAKAKKAKGKKSKAKAKKAKKSKKSKNTGSSKTRTYAPLSVDGTETTASSNETGTTSSSQSEQASATTSSEGSKSSSRTMNPMSVDEAGDASGTGTQAGSESGTSVEQASGQQGIAADDVASESTANAASESSAN